MLFWPAQNPAQYFMELSLYIDRNNKVSLIRCLLVVCTVLGLMQSAAAKEICLKNRIDGEEFHGDLLSFTGTQWNLDTKYGRMQLNIDRFCVCGDCKASGPIPDKIVEIKKQLRLRQSPKKELRIAGSNTMGAEIVPNLIEQLLKEKDGKTPKVDSENQDTRVIEGDEYIVHIEAKGSSTGFQALQEDTSELAMSSRPIKAEEIAALEKAGVSGMRNPGREVVLALDGVVPIVAKNNKLKTISLLELKQIFSGSIVNWSELGLDEGLISVHARNAVSGTFDTFKTLVLETHGLDLVKSAKRYASDSELARAVSQDPNAIGFVAVGALSKVQSDIRALKLKGACGIVQKPDIFNIKTEDYVLSRRLLLYSTTSNRIGLTRQFIDFALLDEAQRYIVDAGFISQSVKVLDNNTHIQRLRDIQARAETPEIAQIAEKVNGFLLDAKRLSITFRFNTRAKKLDNKSLEDVTRLARYIQTSAPQSKLLLVGFADGVGSFSSNMILSQQRAEQAEILMRENGIPAENITTIGLGELLPTFCNTTEIGRARNRRVEVWLR